MFGVSRQVYYRKVRSDQRKEKKAAAAVALVGQVRGRMPRLGTRKLSHVLGPELKSLGIGRDKLFTILRSNHLLIAPKRSYRITTDSHHRFRKHTNQLTHLSVTGPEQAWVSDITYLGDRDHPAYLALITDAYSKKIMGFSVSEHLDTANCVAALRMAVRGRSYKEQPLIHHSDRGIQYCSDAYQAALSKEGISCSMTTCYDPYENAVAERVNGILKQEFGLDAYRIPIGQLHLVTTETIGIYNNERPHYSNYMRTPAQMHEQRQIKMRTYRREPVLLEEEAIHLRSHNEAAGLGPAASMERRKLSSKPVSVI